MIESTLSRAADCMGGRLQGNDAEFRGISTDTRKLQKGELFFALQGPNFDGAAFVAAAAEELASAAVVTEALDADIPVIVVADTLQGLAALASNWREQMPATIVGITGSNGKTTLKEMVASCLSLAARTLPTEGNLNNEIGVPLMLSRLDAGHRYAVIEMGANHAGEIARLTNMAKPSVVAITNAGPAHLEGFGSIDGVARAKGEILTGTPRPERVVLNADDPYFEYWCTLASDVEIVSFGMTPQADFRASEVTATAAGSAFTLHMPHASLQIELPLFGAHNVMHACTAAAIAASLGIADEHIKAGLQAAKPVAGRLRPLTCRSGDTLYDDSYNANPESVIAAAKFLAALPGNSWLVLGDMAELGDGAVNLHATVGCEVRQSGVARLLAVGPLSRHTVEGFGAGGQWFADRESLVEYLQATLDGAGNVLVKGSRSMGMEAVVEALRDQPDSAGG